MRHFKPHLTLRLPVDLLPRLNAQAERFPMSNPHALGLYLLKSGLERMESGKELSTLKTAKKGARHA